MSARLSLKSTCWCLSIALASLPLIGRSQSAPVPAAKEFEADLVTATVWPNGYSEVQWTVGDKAYRIISNVDFRVFPAALTLDSGTKVFNPVIVVTFLSADDVANIRATGALDSRDLPAAWPQTLPAQGGAAQYAVEQPVAVGASDPGLGVVNALHTYFNAYGAQLVAAAAARQQAAAVPPPPKRIPTPLGIVFKRIEHPTGAGEVQQ